MGLCLLNLKYLQICRMILTDVCYMFPCFHRLLLSTPEDWWSLRCRQINCCDFSCFLSSQQRSPVEKNVPLDFELKYLFALDSLDSQTCVACSLSCISAVCHLIASSSSSARKGRWRNYQGTASKTFFKGNCWALSQWFADVSLAAAGH